jgi:hypothetical protein
MKSRKPIVLSGDRSDSARILLNCSGRVIIIGVASMSIANSIHDSQHENALKSHDRQKSLPQPIAEMVDDRDHTSKQRDLPLIADRI